VTDGPQQEPMSAEEQRLVALLALLRSELITSRPGLVGAIMSRVRWQRLLREVFEAVGTFASSLARGLGVLASRGEGRDA
jgi:hypothetical protein